MTDVLLISVPLMQIKQPAPAIYHLKGQLEEGGVSCTAIDTNILLYDHFKVRWGEISNMLQWHTYKPSVSLYTEVITQYYEILDDIITKEDPTWIGLSIFSTNSRRIGVDAIEYIRNKWPDKKILIGGMGLGDSGGDRKFEYAAKLLDADLIDYFISGEGEVAITELICNGNDAYPGINSSPKQIAILEGLAFANYEDCDHELYPFEDFDSGVPTYVLTGSRGCVRNCDLTTKSRFSGFLGIGCSSITFSDTLLNPFIDFTLNPCYRSTSFNK